MAWAIMYFRLETQKKSPAISALEDIPEPFRAALVEDIEAIAERESWSGVSVKAITGHSPMAEVRTDQYRAFFVVNHRVLWVLHACKKQDQKRAIKLAAERMDLVLGR